MEIQLTAKQLKVTPAIRSYVQEKVEKAQKYFDHIVWGQCFLFIEKRAHNAEIVIHAPGQTFRALAVAADLYSAVDLASDKIDAQLKKFKERLKSRYKGRPSSGEVEAAVPVPAHAALRIDVIKQPVAPMTAEEAVEEMERLGHTFRLFQDRASQQIHLVYRGTDEIYKILQPVKKSGR
ncbi:MAG: ribosome-associated translation inhibitor RaiA [Elusimicrobia bacterium]|nr:ribosome-associated translation inhibitor RaiA [Elusimicrobiota bacterium]